MAAQASRLSVHARPVRVATGLIAALVMAAYAALTLVHTAPNSPAAVRLKPGADGLLLPWFGQRWTLFAPDPPDSFLTSYLVVRQRGADGIDREAEPRPLSAAFIRHAHGRRWAPGRVDRLAGQLDRDLGNVVSEELRLAAVEQLARDRDAPGAEALEQAVRARMGELPDAQEIARRRAALAVRRAELLVDASRLLSAAADGYGLRDVSAVRIVIDRTEVKRFSRRDEAAEPAPVRLFDSQWLPYVEGVGR